MNQTVRNTAINNGDLRSAAEAANRSGVAYIGEYNLGACVAIPVIHQRAGVYLFPGKSTQIFNGTDSSELDRVVEKIDGEAGTLKVIIGERTPKIFMMDYAVKNGE